MNFPHLQESFDRAAAKINPLIGGILDRALSGADISFDEATQLFEADGADLPALILAANHLRTEAVGDIVTYVVNRNINFTNVCVKACGFCAFSRGHLADEGYFLPIEEIIRRGQEARDLGATAFHRAAQQAGVPDERMHFELFEGTHGGIEYRYPLAVAWLAEQLR